MLVMAISDVLTMNFFWLVRDEGSWLDIGTSISHFVIASLLCVFVAGLEFVSEIFVSGVDIGVEEKEKEIMNGSTDSRKADEKNIANGHATGQSNGSAKGS